MYDLDFDLYLYSFLSFPYNFHYSHFAPPLRREEYGNSGPEYIKINLCPQCKFPFKYQLSKQILLMAHGIKLFDYQPHPAP